MRAGSALAAPSLVGGDPRDPLAEDQRVDVVGALVGLHGLEVHHVAADRVLVGDAVRAEHVARHARDLERPVDVVALAHRDVGEVELALRP